jgi:hypothetical protein
MFPTIHLDQNATFAEHHTFGPISAYFDHGIGENP